MRFLLYFLAVFISTGVLLLGLVRPFLEEAFWHPLAYTFQSALSDVSAVGAILLAFFYALSLTVSAAFASWYNGKMLRQAVLLMVVFLLSFLGPFAVFMVIVGFINYAPHFFQVYIHELQINFPSNILFFLIEILLTWAWLFVFLHWERRFFAAPAIQTTDHFDKF